MRIKNKRKSIECHVPICRITGEQWINIWGTGAMWKQVAHKITIKNWKESNHLGVFDSPSVSLLPSNFWALYAVDMCIECRIHYSAHCLASSANARIASPLPSQIKSRAFCTNQQPICLNCSNLPTVTFWHKWLCRRCIAIRFNSYCVLYARRSNVWLICETLDVSAASMLLLLLRFPNSLSLNRKQ